VRRGRALLPHPEPLRDDTGRIVVTRQVIVFLTGVHVSFIRRNLQPVACHLVGKVPLYDVEEAQRLASTRATTRA
jgi:hypothetical protein